ncbi:MAG: hypothetical protein QNI90_05465 [Dinoroseobacter sp.]|nr:hypothetical protein [Dinoroseobacter sp.]
MALKTAVSLSEEEMDTRIVFHDAIEVMEVSFDEIEFDNSEDVNRFYDRLEARIAATGYDRWFFLVNYSGTRIDNAAWLAFSRRGKALNLAHSQGSVRVDASDITRKQIERDAGTERFDPNLFADRDTALARLAKMPSQRKAPRVEHASFDARGIASRVRFLKSEQIMEIDFTDLRFQHGTDVDTCYDVLETQAKAAGGQWYFLINYEGCRIMSEAWVQYAARGKRFNEVFSLGSVRYAPGSETETDIRLRAESQGFRPNIRNTRAEALERIAEMKAAAAS